MRRLRRECHCCVVNRRGQSGADPRDATVADYMTAAPAAVHLDADIHEVASTMFEVECRHLPVMSEDELPSLKPSRRKRAFASPVILSSRA